MCAQIFDNRIDFLDISKKNSNFLVYFAPGEGGSKCTNKGGAFIIPHILYATLVLVIFKVEMDNSIENTMDINLFVIVS